MSTSTAGAQEEKKIPPVKMIVCEDGYFSLTYEPVTDTIIALSEEGLDLYSPVTGKMIKQIEADRLEFLCTSPQNKRLYAVNAFGKLFQFRLPDFKLVRAVDTGHRKEMSGIFIVGNDEEMRIATAAFSGELFFWKTDPLVRDDSLAWKGPPILDSAVSRNNRQIAIGNYDETVVLDYPSLNSHCHIGAIGQTSFMNNDASIFLGINDDYEVGLFPICKPGKRESEEKGRYLNGGYALYGKAQHLVLNVSLSGRTEDSHIRIYHRKNLAQPVCILTSEHQVNILHGMVVTNDGKCVARLSQLGMLLEFWRIDDETQKKLSD